MKKKIKDLKLGELIINCCKYNDCSQCPFIDIKFNCKSFRELLTKIDLNQKINFKKGV